ncbi:4-alpha-glucanotransferase [Ferruginibacter yonginensis]|uniref:4-alpha-glucanotransferase n=1 Tax=Ferruginibacter yonginensis TaxID=1310416 RepID=A0ABV8QNB6_9BACT
MIFQFKVQYATEFGEMLFIELPQYFYLPVRVDLHYSDANCWVGQINLPTNLHQQQICLHVWLHSNSNLSVITTHHFFINEQQHFSNIFINIDNIIPNQQFKITNRLPFQSLIHSYNDQINSSNDEKKCTHLFSVKAPLLQAPYRLCLTGSAAQMHHFDCKQPLFFQIIDEVYQLAIQLNDDETIEYKLAIFDTRTNCIVAYEPGENRQLITHQQQPLQVICLQQNFEAFAWKAAGINVPIFSIRTHNSWGSGDFSDLKMLVDYASAVGFKLIQLLPINDTNATYTDADSYPYSAISSFALHPKYMDVALVAKQYQYNIPQHYFEKIALLQATTHCEHTAVVQLKMQVVQIIFKHNNGAFLNEVDWDVYFKHHQHWLQPFAVFCVLRDYYNTVDYTQWPAESTYSEGLVDHITNPNHPLFEQILLVYFIQYQLHRQLSNVVAYSRSKNIILKADLPIGVGRFSADTWQYPQYFHMKMQAGAPPDAFSTIGQNWSFPTYDIENMAADNFSWFKKRMQHFEYYFDAIRIDHVLGFFRIWSIPTTQVDGRMGYFVPAIALQKSDFDNVDFDEKRFCEPYLNDALMAKYFGADVATVTQLFFDGYKLKPPFTTQRQIENYFKNHPHQIKWQQALYDIIADVILLKNDDGYHFRINVQQTNSYQHLAINTQQKINDLYHHYFYELQNNLWQQEGSFKLQMLTNSTQMLLCAEDLGMVPVFTEATLQALKILSLQVQQMPKNSNEVFSNTNNATYNTVVMPATHDMPTMRLWWQQQPVIAQQLFEHLFNSPQQTPYFCEPWVAERILYKHLNSKAMLSVFLLQDVLAMNGKLRQAMPEEERINDPANPQHVWNYRMPLHLEDLMLATTFNHHLQQLITESGR